MLNVRRDMWRSDYVHVNIEKNGVTIDLGCLDQDELKKLIEEIKSDLEDLESCVVEED